MERIVADITRSAQTGQRATLRVRYAKMLAR
jgi:hypothetical protein